MASNCRKRGLKTNSLIFETFIMSCTNQLIAVSETKTTVYVRIIILLLLWYVTVTLSHRKLRGNGRRVCAPLCPGLETIFVRCEPSCVSASGERTGARQRHHGQETEEIRGGQVEKRPAVAAHHTATWIHGGGNFPVPFSRQNRTRCPANNGVSLAAKCASRC